MNVRKTVKKVLALGAGATMVGATVMGAAAYDLADYPAPYITDGVFNGMIVVGEKAATSDVLGAIDIAASLQALAVSEEAVKVPGQAGEVSLSGDVFRIESASDKFELREAVGDVYDTFDEGDLDALGGGTITTDEGDTDYNQYLRLEILSSGSNALVNWGVNYIENDEDEMGDFLVIERDSTKGFFEWELEFGDGLESSVDANGDLEDIENEVFNIFGTDYSFVDSSISNSDTGLGLTLEFMAGDVSSTLREGETKTFTIDGVEYEVTLIFVSDPSSSSTNPEAKFMVNGEVTKSLQDGETDTLSGGLQIGVRDILVNSRDGIVEFFLGADKVQFQDTDTTDTTFYSGVEIANEKIEDAELQIRSSLVTDGNSDGTADSGDVLEITSIKYRLKADAATKQDLYIPPGDGLKPHLDEPEGMLSPTFDIKYEGLTAPEVTDFIIDARSDNQYELTFTNIRGHEFTVPFFSVADDGEVQFGDDSSTNTENDDLVLIEGGTGWNIGLDDYFIVSSSDAGSVNKKSVSTVLQFQDIDTSENRLTFEDLSGSTKDVTYDGSTFVGTLTMSGHSFGIDVNETTSKIRVDLNGDGDDTDTSAPVDFVVQGGTVVSLDNIYWLNSSTAVAYTWASVMGDGLTVGDVDTVTGNYIYLNMSMGFDSSLYDEPTSGNQEQIFWDLRGYDSSSGSGSNYVDLVMAADSAQTIYNANASNKFQKFELKEPQDMDNHKLAMSTYGALIDVYDPTGSNDPTELTISVPDEQVFAQVFLTAGTVKRSEGAAGSIVTERVNDISVGLAVLDSDAPSLGSANMIVVGGPCVNTIAAGIMGNPAVCTEGFEPGKAMIKSMESGGKVAILVAGYEAENTLGASYVLANFEDYAAFQGEEVEVLVPDLNNIVVQTVG